MGVELILVVLEFDVDDLCFMVMIMLVNINDVFIGLNVVNVSNMVVGDIKMFMIVIWDVGIEVNIEIVVIMLGFVVGVVGGGGEVVGYDVVRDDFVDVVRFY